MTVLANQMTENELLSAIVDAALFRGWMVHHDRRSDSANPHWGTQPGFPDLVLARAGRVLFLELKTEKGVVTPAQDAWLLAVLGMVVRPSNLDEALSWLR